MQIINGILVGLTLSYLEHFESTRRAISGVMHSAVTEGAANIGFLYLMFLAGSSIRPQWTDTEVVIPVAVFGFVVPFAATFITARYLFHYPLYASLAVAISLSITAEAPTVAAFTEVGLLNTEASSVVLSAGMIDDVAGLILFVGFALYCNLKLTSAMMLIPIASLLCFFIGYYTNAIQNNNSIAFLAPLVYVFFILIGYNSDLDSFFESKKQGIFWCFLLVAVLSKIGGVYAGSRLFNKLDDLTTRTVAWGMNSRGIIGMAVVLLALKCGIIDRTLYTMLIFVSLLTIVMFPLYLKLNKHRLVPDQFTQINLPDQFTQINLPRSIYPDTLKIDVKHL
jgi:Kef-type K+ transport system membrane component KefB